jgi:pSer/pThr/pTyr-binding forkhead associated (FHA) protein
MRRVNLTLVAVRPDGQKRDVPFKRARLVIGRKKECDVRIPVPSVSREHCELKVEGGKVLVRDLGSSNGTYVNGARTHEAELAAGSILGVGPAVFVLRIDGKPADIDAKKSFTTGKAPEPVAAAASPKARPQAPGGSKPAARPKPSEDDLDMGDLDESSVSGFDFSLLDDSDEKKQPRL